MNVGCVANQGFVIRIEVERKPLGFLFRDYTIASEIIDLDLQWSDIKGTYGLVDLQNIMTFEL